MKVRNVFVVVVLLGATGLGAVPARADHVGTLPINHSLMDYDPIGHYGPTADGGAAPQIPLTPSNGPPAMNNPNPSGKWIAYDTNVWESLTLPYRHPGDNCNSIPASDRHADCRSGDRDDDTTDPAARTGYTGYQGPSGTSTVHGTCAQPGGDVPGPAGQCFNNQLEYLDYWEHAMESTPEFQKLGVTVDRYGFISAGSGLPRGAPLAASGGQAYNIAATIPGTTHPEETVIVGAHYDFTDSGPAAAWDSAEGHTEIMRMAWLMADYFLKTGTRPAATIRFIPWDSEESGTFGSQDYVNNNIPPGEFDEVRAYFNVDPCAGAYPAFKEGTGPQVHEVLQIADPANWEDQPEIKARMEAFNAGAEATIDKVLERLDDRITRPGGVETPIFVSDAEAAAGSDDVGSLGGAGSDRGKIETAVGGLALFTSDYANFEEVGIPIFNLFPDYFGPHADDSEEAAAGRSTEGLSILHTNNDHLMRINRLTGGLTSPGNAIDPTLGTYASEGWAKGMEFCAQVEASYMLEVGQAVDADTDVVSYYEALPNEALQGQNVTFDATGTYQYANVADRTMRDPSTFTYEWDFGDGTTRTTNGPIVQHAYSQIGRYTTTLTVTGNGGQRDSMSIPVEITPSDFLGPILRGIQPEDAKDGNFELGWDYPPIRTRPGFQHFLVEESHDYRELFGDTAETFDNWEVAAPTGSSMIQRWQPSDSSTTKVRGNQRRSGQRSFWAGQSQPFIQPPAVVQGNSIMTLKNPITVPKRGNPQLSYWSLFQNEGDDQGRVEIALTDGSTPADQLEWRAADVIQAVFTAVGQEDYRTCDPSNPDTFATPFENRSIELTEYKGKKILVRFNMSYGAENRSVSQPCGWYVEDISLGTGTWNPLDTTAQSKHVVLNRPNNLWAYRVKAVYNDGVTTAASNVELANVTNSREIPKKDLRRCLRIPGAHILGSVKKDKLTGTDGAEVICGFAGNDKLKALGGDDVVFGFKGKDRASGGSGRDRLFGDQGNDRLRGGKGKDRLKGGKGKDRLNGGGGKDRCAGKGDAEQKC